MKVNCEVIRDLLPLYRDGVCSEESRALVGEHLGTCERCNEELRLMAETMDAPHVDVSEETVVKASARAWKKSKKRSFFSGWFLMVVLICLLVGVRNSYHWFTTVEPTDIDGMAEQATAYFGGRFDVVVEDVLAVEQRGDYLAMLFTAKSGNLGMCVFDRDKLFSDRWCANGGIPYFEPGDVKSWNFGPNGDAVIIFCGAELPEEAAWYTFQNNGITYTCPIEEGKVLDVFVIPDNRDIGGMPQMLDSNMQEIPK